MSFLAPPAIRKVIAVPTQDKIDFRAACFCHKNIVDIGFVCSVCLSSKDSFWISSRKPFSHDHLSILPTRPSLLNLSVRFNPPPHSFPYFLQQHKVPDQNPPTSQCFSSNSLNTSLAWKHTPCTFETPSRPYPFITDKRLYPLIYVSTSCNQYNSIDVIYICGFSPSFCPFAARG